MSALLSLAAGLVVGLAYGVSGIRSPAPPAVALLGLLGMLAGEHVVAFARHHLAPPPGAADQVAQPGHE